MAIQYSVTHRTNAMTQLITDIGASCVIKIWAGTVPADAAVPDAGAPDMLVTFTGNATAFGTAGSGTLTVSAIASVSATNSGTATYFRIYNASAPTTTVMQGTCGTVGTDMILTNSVITSGQNIQFTYMTVTAFGA